MKDGTTCPICGRTVPAGEYCGACGGRIAEESASDPLRRHAFAANPSEHVLHPSITSTLFPHLPQRRSLPYRLTLLAVASALVLFGYLRLTGPTVAVAVAAVPVLYLLYLYEVEAYGEEPLYVIAVTAGVGAVLGAGWALLTGRFITQTQLLQTTPQGAPAGRIFLAAVLLPLAAQLLMLIGPLILRFTRAYDEVLDGFVFGAASALGFVFASSLLNLFPEVHSGPISVAADVSSALRGIWHGLLVPLIDAGTTGLITAALWLHRQRIRSLPRDAGVTSLASAVILASAIQVGLGLVDILVVKTSTAVLVYLGVAITLLFLLRIALHHMLLAEAVEGEIGPETPCFHCERMVPRMPFCPNCGIARRATPKLGPGREGRAVR